jgi:hypothetical protein
MQFIVTLRKRNVNAVVAVHIAAFCACRISSIAALPAEGARCFAPAAFRCARCFKCASGSVLTHADCLGRSVGSVPCDFDEERNFRSWLPRRSEDRRSKCQLNCQAAARQCGANSGRLPRYLPERITYAKAMHACAAHTRCEYLLWGFSVRSTSSQVLETTLGVQEN